MAKLFDQQQLSAGVQEFEEHLQRVRARDWSADCQLAKPRNDLPPPPRREAVRKAASGNARGAAPGKPKAPPAGPAIETFRSRRLILALAAIVLVSFAGAMSLALSDGGALTAQEQVQEQAEVSAVASDAPSTATPTSQAAQANQATQAKTPPAVSAPGSATSETYVATIRPDGSLAPDTTPHATVVTPPATVAAPSPDAISAILKGGEQSEPASSAPAEANAPGETPAAAKPAKKRTVAHANLASVNSAAADGNAAAAAANPADPGHPAAAAKPAASRPAAAKPATKPRAASVAGRKTDGEPRQTPDADDGGIFESAKQAVGSLTGAVKKLVGAD